MNKDKDGDDDVQAKAAGWRARRAEELPDPPTLEERPNNVREPELRPRRRKDENEVQYNVRIPQWLKSKLQDLVRSENLPMAELLPKMLELYQQHRRGRKQHGLDEGSAGE